MTPVDKLLLATDAICQRYSVLPSEFFRSGDMIDFVVAQAGAGYQQYAMKMQKQGIDPTKGYYHGKTQDELLAMMEKADALIRKKQNNSQGE